FAKALAWFRGRPEVGFEDVRQIVPFVLHDKLVQDADSPFFDTPENAAFRSDKIGSIRRLFDLSCSEYDRLDRDRDDVVAQFEAQFASGLEGVNEQEARARLVHIERTLAEWSKGRKLYGHMFDDIL